MKIALEKSGVDTTLFKAHSVRGASGSMARAQGATLETILSRGNWSNKYTWHKFYNKNILGPAREFSKSSFSVSRFEEGGLSTSRANFHSSTRGRKPYLVVYLPNKVIFGSTICLRRTSFLQSRKHMLIKSSTILSE